MGESAMVCRHPVAASEGSTEIGIVGPITHTTIPTLRDYLRLVIEDSASPTLRLDLSCCTNINVEGMLSRCPSRSTLPAAVAETPA